LGDAVGRLTAESDDMIEVIVQIVRFVADSQPGFVACELLDAAGRRHTLVDKVPIFTTAPLDEQIVDA
jgi:hypothetical protein